MGIQFFWGGGCMTREQASYEGAVEGLTITRPIKPLARAAPATSSTTGPTGAPPGTAPSAALQLHPPPFLLVEEQRLPM